VRLELPRKVHREVARDLHREVPRNLRVILGSRIRLTLSRMPALAAAMAKLTPADMAALRATGQTIDAAFQIGKSGVTDGVVKELQAHLSREPLVKVKLLKSALGEADIKAVAADLATRARVVLVETRGHTALFHRPPRHKREAGDF
jgi:RNA-binding protein